MKKVIFFTFTVFYFISCQNGLIEESDTLSFSSIKSVTINTTNDISPKLSKDYIEVSFLGKNMLPEYGLMGDIFSDNGQGSDKVAGDGIYTSAQKGIVLDPDANSRKKGVSVTCDVDVVPCNDSDCPYWGGCCFGNGPCSCIEFTNCSITIEWE